MIDYELYCKIKNLHENKSLNPSQIAAELAVDRRTICKWIDEKQYRPRRKTKKACKLDPFKGEVTRMLDSHPYTAVQIFNKIQEQGFDGSYSMVKKYVRKIRPKHTQAFLTLSFAPGESAQVDWGSYGSVRVGSTSRRLSFFVMVLCYSRMMYAEFFVSQTMEHFLCAHQHAFDYFKGVPANIMVDNLKSAVLRRAVGNEPVFNPKYLDFANHYGFTIKPCNVRKGNEKGRVENAVGYIKKNFLSGTDIPNFESIHAAFADWLDRIANARIHGTTRKQPVELWQKEKPCLLPLPVQPFDIGTISQVRASSQFRITMDTNRYSVPAEYAGTRLTVKIYPDRLCIYNDEKLVARHVRSYDRHRDFENPDHPKALLEQRRKAGVQKIFARFLMLSPRAEEYYQMLANRRMNPRHHVRKIVALSEIYGKDAVTRAMEDAFTFQAFSCEYIANILEQRARIIQKPGALQLTRREDLLDIEIQQPDMTLYQPKNKEDI